MDILADCQSGLQSLLAGAWDSIAGSLYSFQIVIQNPKIRGKILLCFMLNGLILALSIVVFEYILLPIVLYAASWLAELFGKALQQSALEWMETLISYVFTGLWLLPMFVICTPINNLWFREIALAAGDHLKAPKHIPELSQIKRALADILYGMAVEVSFLVQATVASLLPLGGWLLCLLHMALLYSLYSFDYRWFYQGVMVQRRLSEVETKWPYFLGFGLPLASLTAFSLLTPVAVVDGSAVRHVVANAVISTSVFAVAFPLLIMSAFVASPRSTSLSRMPVFKLSKMFCNKFLSFILR